ncbi:MAG: restriction endonuclease [Planctomycetes bacterium]|nr:restriction endonuclease [Planctomycetota bacterium]
MALWLVRAEKYGQSEQRFLDECRIYLTWHNLDSDLGKATNMEELRAIILKHHPDFAGSQLRNYAGQIWSFYTRMKPGDWFVLPSKSKSVIHIGEIVGDYTYDNQSGKPFPHYRKVKWIAKDIPRANFDQDLLYSFGAFMAICQIKRNNAENRIHEMAQNKWKSTKIPKPPEVDDEGGEQEDSTTDLEELAQDQIAKLIIAKFKGHGMARLVDGILKAQGYTTYLSPEGPDKGVDILAAAGPLGFGEPRICVQVKSGDGTLDRPTLDQLIGTMQNVQAHQGLLVSWGGFKSSVDKEEASQFFRVRLWDQKELISQLLEHYDKLDDDLRADLPLKRIWTVAIPESEGD